MTDYSSERQKYNYISKNLSIDNTRYDKSRLGDRNLISITSDGTRYYSSLDAEIYFGDRFLDTVVRIMWVVQQSTLPIFGYNSYVFDDLAVGARQISGQFLLNFTKSTAMYDLLNNIEGTRRNELSTGDDFNKNLSWSSFYDKEHCASWDKSFNIRIGYGDYTQNSKSNTMQVLYGVQITGYQQEIGIDGQVIGELYSFVAKDVRYELTSSSQPSSEGSSSGETSKVDEDEEYIIALEPAKIEEEGKVYLITIPYRAATNVTIKQCSLDLLNADKENIGGVDNLDYDNPNKVITATTQLSNTSIIRDMLKREKKYGSILYALCNLKIGYTVGDMLETHSFDKLKLYYKEDE